MMPGAENAPLDIDVSNTYDAGTGADGYGAAGGGARDDEDGFNAIEAIGSKAPNLREHLEQQARLAFSTPGRADHCRGADRGTGCGGADFGTARGDCQVAWACRSRRSRRCGEK